MRGMVRTACLAVSAWVLAVVLVGAPAGSVARDSDVAYARAASDIGAVSVRGVAEAPLQVPASQNFSAAADTYVRDILENTNEGGAPFLRITNVGNNRALVRFDQAAIQSFIGSGTVTSAKLRLTIIDNGNNWGSGGRAVGVHRLTKSWTEGNGFVAENSPANRGTGSGVTYECAVDSNIANHAQDCSGSTAWNMDNPAQWPFLAAATDSETISNGQSGVVEWDVTADIVAFKNGSATNNGWIVKKADEGQTGLAKFASRTYATSSARPVLVVNVETAATNTPTPTATSTATPTSTATDTSTPTATATDTSTPTATATATATATSTPVVTPVANPDSFTGTGNVLISVPAGSGVLLNDTPPGGTVASFGPSTGAETAAGSPGATMAGGTLTVNSDGSLTYNPPAGFTGPDTFKYTLSTVNGNAVGTVTITVGDMIWFIDSNAGACATNCGRLTDPYNSLAAFHAVNSGAAPNPQPGQTIFLATGSGPYASNVTLRPGQKLIGQGASASIVTVSGITLAPFSAALPSTGGTRPVVNGTITMDTGSLVRGLNVSSGTSTGVTGSGATGLTVAEVSVTSTTGTAVNFSGATSSALAFTSVSANGAVNGILVSSSSGSFAVTGTGAAGSGGTIQNTTNRGASFIGAANVSLHSMNFVNAGTADLDATNGGLPTGDNLDGNAAIHLATVAGATLDGLSITGGAEHGINGNAVSDFVLSNSALVDIGNEPDEDALHVFNLSGTSAITDTTFNSTVVIPSSTGGDDHVNIQNQSGTLALTIAGGGVTNANKGSGYLFGIRGTANATIDITGVNASNNLAGGIVADAFDTATLALTVTNSTLSSNNDQLAVSAGDSSNVDVDAGGNTFSSPNAADFIGISLLGSAADTGYMFDARIHDNTILTSNGRTADGIVVNNAGGGAMNVAITGNTIDYAGTQRAMLVQAGQDGNGATNVTITGNTIDVELDGAGNAVAGILAQNALVGPGVTSSLCLDIGGAGGLSNTFTHSLGGGIGGGDIRVRQRNDGTVRLPGYAGGATDTAAVIAYLNSRNGEVSSSTATADSSGFAGGAACTQPTP